MLDGTSFIPYKECWDPDGCLVWGYCRHDCQDYKYNTRKDKRNCNPLIAVSLIIGLTDDMLSKTSDTNY